MVFVLALWMVWELVSVAFTAFANFTRWMRPASGFLQALIGTSNPGNTTFSGFFLLSWFDGFWRKLRVFVQLITRRARTWSKAFENYHHNRMPQRPETMWKSCPQGGGRREQKAILVGHCELMANRMNI